jgi:hypothetical protein
LSDDSDGSFEEDSYTFGLDWTAPELFDGRSTVSLDGQYARRCFTTGHPVELDAMHAGRVDLDYDIAFKYSVEVSTSLTLGATVEWHQRDAGTRSLINEAFVSEEKDYRQIGMGIELTYKLLMK